MTGPASGADNKMKLQIEQVRKGGLPPLPKLIKLKF